MFVIWALAVAVRLANLAAMPLEPGLLLVEDAWLYWANALSLLEHGTFADPASSGRMPGYFLLVAGLMGVFGPSLFAVLAVQALLDAVTCVLVGMIGARLSMSVGLVAGLLAAVWPNMVIMSASVLTDSFFTLPFTAMLYASVRFLETGSARWAAWAGLFLGVAIMVRAAAQYFPLAMVFVVVAVPLFRERDWRKGFLAGLAFLVAVALPLTPWLHRNVTQYDALALTSQGGVHLLYWVVPGVLSRTQGIQQGQAVKELREEFQAEMESRELDTSGMNIFASDRAMTNFSLARLAEIPPRDIFSSWGSGMTVNLASPAIVADLRVRAIPHPSFMGTSHLDLLSRITPYVQEASPLYLAVVAVGMIG
ncbi:MAG: glycosyltransferase family 39 protein, partial [Rhodospirillales bacterium]|nr:glycosyltransferase family 39 protein [Rhodospirillales bacterium]